MRVVRGSPEKQRWQLVAEAEAEVIGGAARIITIIILIIGIGASWERSPKRVSVRCAEGRWPR